MQSVLHISTDTYVASLCIYNFCYKFANDIPTLCSTAEVDVFMSVGCSLSVTYIGDIGVRAINVSF